MSELYEELFSQVLLPDVYEAQNNLVKHQAKLVHYTSAEAALKIIKSKQVWLRQTKLMNDFSEIKYGINQLSEVYNKPDVTERFQVFFDKISPNMMERFQSYYNENLDNIEYGTYVLSLAEHNIAENNLGRLSMWRAYGRSSGVAIVVNLEHMENKDSTLSAYTLPAEYFGGDDVERFIFNLLDRCHASVDKFKTLGEDLVAELLFRSFVFTVMGIKHPGFREEKEWRVIANPALFKMNGLNRAIEIINGVPQKVLKMPLEGTLETNDQSRTMDALIYRIIIGPSEAASAIADALMVELEQAGVSNPKEKVWISNIPFRGN